MLIKGEALIGTVTLNFWVHGEKSNWTVKITGPNGLTLEDSTVGRLWCPLFCEMLADATEKVASRRKLSVGTPQ